MIKHAHRVKNGAAIICKTEVEREAAIALLCAMYKKERYNSPSDNFKSFPNAIAPDKPHYFVQGYAGTIKNSQWNVPHYQFSELAQFVADFQNPPSRPMVKVWWVQVVNNTKEKFTGEPAALCRVEELVRSGTHFTFWVTEEQSND